MENGLTTAQARPHWIELQAAHDLEFRDCRGKGSRLPTRSRSLENQRLRGRRQRHREDTKPARLGSKPRRPTKSRYSGRLIMQIHRRPLCVDLAACVKPHTLGGTREGHPPRRECDRHSVQVDEYALRALAINNRIEFERTGTLFVPALGQSSSPFKVVPPNTVIVHHVTWIPGPLCSPRTLTGRSLSGHRRRPDSHPHDHVWCAGLWCGWHRAEAAMLASLSPAHPAGLGFKLSGPCPPRDATALV